MEEKFVQLDPLHIGKVEDLPELFKESSFDNFNDKKILLLKSYKEKCMLFAENKTDKWAIFMMGKVGNGKTHLAVSIAKALPHHKALYEHQTDFPANTLFLKADHFFIKCNEAVELKMSKITLIKKLLSYDLLILDDLSLNNFSPAKGENLYSLIDEAYTNKKRIVITSNITVQEIEKIEPRIASRIAEMAHLMLFNFTDHRLTKQ